MNSFIQRSITGALFVIVLLSCIYLSAGSFILLFLLITGLTLSEFYKLTRKQITRSGWIQIIAGIYLVGASFMIAQQTVISPLRLISPYLLFLLILFIAQLYAKRKNPIEDWGITMLGQIYIALPFALLNFIVFQPSTDFAIIRYNPNLLIAFFVFIWLNDTGAFLIGSAIGKHRLFERISPKKSWEGFFGGIFVALIGGVLFAQFIPTLTTVEWMGMAFIVAIASTWGDLCESLIKRTLQVKDSGHILPGHGGMLDRFDSLLLASPAVIIYLSFIL